MSASHYHICKLSCPDFWTTPIETNAQNFFRFGTRGERPQRPCFEGESILARDSSSTVNTVYPEFDSTDTIKRRPDHAVVQGERQIWQEDQQYKDD